MKIIKVCSCAVMILGGIGFATCATILLLGAIAK